MKVVAHLRFVAWYRSLRQDRSAAAQFLAAGVNVAVGYLARSELDELRRPRAERVASSRHYPKMWELRHAARTEAGREVNLRVLAVVDERVGVVLLAGDKTGNWREWYEAAVPSADALYDDFLRRYQ
jgi:hypothetical protein